MSSLSEYKRQFEKGEIDKSTYIEIAYEKFHSHLLEYPEQLDSSNLNEIRIHKEGVDICFSDPAVWMKVPQDDTRTAPVEALNFGDYEASEIRMFRKMFAALGGASARFLDIGANAGFYTLAMSYYFPEAMIEAFEPLPATFSLLNHNLSLNETRNVKTHNFGLSEKEEVLKFFTYAGVSGAASMSKNLDRPDVVEVECSVKRLDDLNTSADIIKCDVEGAELFTMRGAADLLQRDNPAIMMELLRKWCAKFDYHPNEVITLLSGFGYGCFVIEEDALVPCDSITEETIDTNFVFLHSAKHEVLIQGLAVSK